MAASCTDNGECNGNGINGQQNEGSSLSKSLQYGDKLLIHGGNISNWNRTKRKTTPDSSDELAESMTTTLSSFVPLSNYSTKKKKMIRCVNKSFMEKIQPDERVHLKISVKIFAIDLRPSLISDSLFRAMCELGVESIETLLLTLPDIPNPDGYFEALKTMWEEMENLHDCGYVHTIGTCDLDKNTLEKLHNWARIKPEINQVNLASCCVMPKDLVEYSKTRDIQLLTHADPRDMLNEERLQQVLSGVSDEINTEGWEPVWALRYSVLVKCRGVIKNKAYIVSCERTKT